MPQTYTSAWQFIQDGDTTSADPQALVATDSPITVLTAEIQWEGSQTSETTTTTDYSTNTNTATAQATEQTDTAYNENSDYVQLPQESGFASTSFPSVPSGYSFAYHELEVYIGLGSGGDDTDLPSSYGNVDGTVVDNTGELDYNRSTSTNYVGENRAVQTNEATDGFVTLEIIARTYGESTVIEFDTASASYPSVPSGYSFDRHYWREEKNGSYENSGNVYSNSVGDSRSVTSTDPSNTWTLEMETRGEDSTTTTTYYDTHDPSVSGDVSGSYTGTLGDGETSTWQALSGLTAGASNTFEHAIQESNEASVRFRFEWEQVAADPAYGTVGFYDDDAGVYRECAVADPSDSKLVYDHIAVYNKEQSEWGILDIVDVTNDAAIESHAFYDSTNGWLAPRQYGTTSK